MPIRDDSLVARYIRAIENSDSTGYKNGRWYQPDLPGYDVNNRGFGVDIVHNVNASNLTKNRQGKWLTEEEERKIRNEHIEDNIRALETKAPSYILRNPPSEDKQAMAVGILYRGDSVMQNPTVRESYLSGSDDDMQKVVYDYYKSKKVSERAQRHNHFFNPNQSNTKKSNVPSNIRKPTLYTPPSYKPEQFVLSKKYDDGGYLNNDWDSLSYKDKAEMMKVAINNGITTLPEIKEAYNEFAKGGKMNSWTMQDEAGYRYWRSRLPKNLRDTDDNIYDMRAAYKAGMQPEWNEDDKLYHLGSRDPQSGRILKSPHHPTYLKALIEDGTMGYYPTMDEKGNTYTETWRGNKYGDGGDLYSPSSRIKKDIATWEGSQMRRNNSFDSMTRQFNDTIPSNVRSRLSQEQLDALYSYGYNVGMGKLRDRVLPTLINYTQGRANNEDVQKSMWAAGDKKLKGLAKRRDWERGMFGGNYWEPHGKPVKASNPNTLGSHIDLTSQMLPQGFFDNFNSQVGGMALPEFPMPGNINLDADPATAYKPPVIDNTLFVQSKREEPVFTYDPQQEKLDRLQGLNTVFNMFGESTPLAGIFGNNESPGLMQYVNAIYGS